MTAVALSASSIVIVDALLRSATRSRDAEVQLAQVDKELGSTLRVASGASAAHGSSAESPAWEAPTASAESPAR